MNTPFKDTIVPTPGAGDSAWGATRGGADLADGQKETGGIMGTGVTYVDVPDGPKAGSNQLDAAAKLLGSQTSKTSPDLC